VRKVGYSFILCTLCALVLVWGEVASGNTNQWEDRPLIVVHSNNTPPLSFVGLNNEPKGFVVDYWRTWSNKNGIPIKFVQTDWPGTLRMMRDGEADIHGGLYFNEERDEFLDYADSYFDQEAALFVRNSIGIKDISELGDRPVAVLDQGYSEFYLKEKYPELILKPYKTSKHMVAAAIAGEVDALLTESATLVYQFGTNAKINEFSPIGILYERPLRAAVAQGNTDLLRLVEKGMANLSTRDREHVFNRWIVVEAYPGWLLPTIILGGVVVAALLWLFMFTSKPALKQD